MVEYYKRLWLKEKLKNKKLKQTILKMKREILGETDQLKEKIKDIMFLEKRRVK